MADDAQYHAGLMLKVNLKLGGINCIAGRGGLKLSRGSVSTMVIGIDVNHAGAGSRNPSFAAVVGSVDEDVSKYHSIVEQQNKQKSEPIDGMEGKMAELLRAFVEKHPTRRPPQRIIVYRDGVAHNMFDEIAEKEISAIERACAKCPGYNEGGYTPRLVFIVSQMRAKARFGEWGMPMKGKGGQDWQNCKPGTVVDSGVTEAGKDNFYLISAYALQGTARAPHYHVLRNDEALPLGEIERFTFDLCVLYARATKVVSRPAPVYYAHRAAFLGPYYDQHFRDGAGAWETSSISSGGSSSNVGNVLPGLKRQLYYA
mmetsp:Transcript_10820/g.34280  ORF Transcript_10820/g.34280 Transcript_10820/m.34280 type:complete len:314 (+) Transcript_10820:1336-2277(+)